MEQIILLIPNLLGLDPEQFTLWVIVLVAVANVVSKRIPESSTGVFGVIRKIAAFVGLALANRITPNVTSKDISKAIAAGIPDSAVKEAAASLDDAVATGFGSVAFAEALIDVGAPSIAGRRIIEDRFAEDIRREGGE